MATYEVLSSGEPLLFFVGGPGMPARFMLPDARLLAGRFTGNLIDPHGAGGSTPPRDDTAYAHEGHAYFYEEVRQALGPGPVTVHGGSFGGTVALPCDALFPEVNTRCIAVGSSAVGEEVDQEEGGEAAASMEATLARYANAPRYTEARAVWNAWTPRVLAATDPAKVEDMLATTLPLYTAYPDRPGRTLGPRRRVGGPRGGSACGESNGRAVSTSGAISVRCWPGSGVRRWSSAVSAT